MTVLAGGVGAARFLRGLTRHLDQAEVAIVVNTADDDVFHGLSVSPDLDTIVYTLAGLADPTRGWGHKRESFRCLEALDHLGAPTWFRLGDRDLATHLVRTERLRAGWPLSKVTAAFLARHGVAARVLPMTNDRVRTWVHTPHGRLAFQDYLVRRRARDEVRRIEIKGVTSARPAPGVLEAIEAARIVVLPPSNPLVSIAPILGVRGVRQALRRHPGPRVAVCPLVGGRAVRGPLVRMLRGLGHRPTASGVAALYRDLADVFVLDERDRREEAAIRSLGFDVITTDTVMSSAAAAARLASTILRRVDPASR